jgi:hypothetical protein
MVEDHEIGCDLLVVLNGCRVNAPGADADKFDVDEMDYL